MKALKKNWMSGLLTMIFRKKNQVTALSGDDLCRIIERASKNGVKKITVGDLVVEYYCISQSPVIDPVYVPEEVRELASFQAKEDSKAQHVKYKQEELDQMIIEDPLQYEELIRSGDLEDEEI